MKRSSFKRWFEMDNAICRILWLIVALGPAVSFLHAQNVDTSQFEVWLKPATVAHADASFLGNYPMYTSEDKVLQQTLEKIGAFEAGTLFIVGRFPKQENLLRFGKVSLNASGATAGQHQLNYDTIAGSDAILKLTYTISPKYKGEKVLPNLSSDVYIAEIIFIKRAIQSEEARAIESYFALKYSINITANTDDALRKYVYTGQENVWHHQSDFRYDEAVYALGRHDAYNFYQTQTYSSDSRSFSLAFVENPTKGEQNQQLLGDNSILMVAQLKASEAAAFCGGSPELQPYKMRVYGWQVSDHPAYVYMWLDSVYAFTANPVMLDGQLAMPLEYTFTRGGTQLRIPVASLQNERDYFIAWGIDDEGCEPLGHMAVYTCSQSANGQNSVVISVEESGLQAGIQLSNLGTGQTHTYEMTAPMANLDFIAPGQYQVVVQNTQGILIQQVIQMADCGQGGVGVPVYTNTPVAATTHGGTGSVERGINAYPNPIGENQPIAFVFSNLEDIVFEVVISDLKGAIIATDTFTPTQQNNVYSFSFRQKGSFQARFSSPEYTEVKQIIVQ